MPPRNHPPERATVGGRADEELYRTLEARHRELVDRRHALILEVRKLSSEQKSLYDRRQGPQAEVERLYAEHAALGKRLAELRSLREKARHQVETKVIARRELLLAVGPSDPPRPEQIREEIAALERRQQTSALPLDEENALITRLRERSKALAESEAHAAEIAAHARQREAAETAIVEARAAVEMIGQELERARIARDEKMVEIHALLEAAGGMVAEMRAKGRTRADLMQQLDALGKEIADLEREGQEVFQRLKNRRDEEFRSRREFQARRERPPGDLLTTAADRRFEELMKRGKINLGG